MTFEVIQGVRKQPVVANRQVRRRAGHGTELAVVGQTDARALCFAAQQTFATAANPVSITAADTNGDGKADLVAANSSADLVSVLLNTTVSAAGTPRFCRAADFPYRIESLLRHHR
jgi:hypothetical protein